MAEYRGILKDENRVAIEGSAPDILSDLSIIVRSVYEGFVEGGIPSEVAKGVIDKAVELGMKTKEELLEQALQAAEELIDTLREEKEKGEKNEDANTSKEGSEYIN